MGLGRLLKRSAQLAKKTGASFFTEAYLCFRVRPKLSVNWQEWEMLRILGHRTFAREWIRREAYFRWGFTVNPREQGAVLCDKRKTFDRLGEALMGRPYCSTILTSATVDQMLAFWQAHGTLFVKPLVLKAGEGVAVLSADIPEAERRAKLEPWIDKHFLLEPYLHAHPALKAVMPDSLPSLRIHTIRHKDDVRLCLVSALRFGRKGRPSDHSPASYTIYFDAEGKLLAPQAYCAGQLVDIHEDTGYRFADFRLPYWEESVALVKQAARLIPEIPYIGWDVAVTPTGPQLIEANYLSAEVFNIQHFLYLTGLGKGLYRELRALRRFARTGIFANGGGVG